MGVERWIGEGVGKTEMQVERREKEVMKEKERSVEGRGRRRDP